MLAHYMANNILVVLTHVQLNPFYCLSARGMRLTRGKCCYKTSYTHVLLSSLVTVLDLFLRVNFSACQNADTIRGWEQKEDGVNINWQHMQS